MATDLRAAVILGLRALARLNAFVLDTAQAKEVTELILKKYQIPSAKSDSLK